MKEFPQPTEPGFYWARLKKGNVECSVYRVYRACDNKLYVSSGFCNYELGSYIWLSEMIPYPEETL